MVRFTTGSEIMFLLQQATLISLYTQPSMYNLVVPTKRILHFMYIKTCKKAVFCFTLNNSSHVQWKSE